MCISTIFGKFTGLYNYHYNPVLVHFHHPKETPLYYLRVNPCSHLQPLTTTKLSVSIDSPFLDIPNKWNHTICNLLWLAPFTLHNVFEALPHSSTNQHFIPFRGWIIVHCMDRPFCLSIYPPMDIIVYHFTHGWTLELFSLLSYYEWCCREHSYTNLQVEISFISRTGIIGLYSKLLHSSLLTVLISPLDPLSYPLLLQLESYESANLEIAFPG